MYQKFVKTALVYAGLAMAGGVFYREYTKIVGFTGKTTLSVFHAHYLTLGVFFFLLLLLLEKNFGLFSTKLARRALPVYHIGLNITAAGFLVRGIVQVSGTSLARGMDAALSGVAGIGHILLGVGLVLLLVALLGRTKNLPKPG